MVYWMIDLLDKLKETDVKNLKGDSIAIIVGLCREISGASHSGKNRLLFMHHGIADVRDRAPDFPKADCCPAPVFVSFLTLGSLDPCL